MQDRKGYVDIIKSVALLMVFSVHFISLYGGWLNEDIFSNQRIWALTIYYFSDCCCPLFFMATGMVLSKRSFSIRTHYIKIMPILFMYLLASCICGIYKYYIGTDCQKLLIGIITFSTAGYSWYVKYYIILFLAVPFLNVILDRLKDNKGCYFALIFIMAVISSFGSAYRYSPFIESNQWLLIVFKILKNLFPFLYYMIGYTIQANKDRICRVNKGCLCFATVIFLMGESLVKYFLYNGRAIPVVANGYGSWNVIIMSILVCCTIVRYFGECSTNKIIKEISSATLIAYLVSEVFDNILFQMIGKNLPIPIYFWIVWIPLVASCSICLGVVGTKIAKKINYTVVNGFVLQKGK